MDFVNDLKEKGYLWIIMPKRNRKRFLATKADIGPDGKFKDDDLFDEYSLEKNDTWDLEKGQWFRI